MKKSKLLTPYNSKGKTNFPARKKSGVYMIFKNKTLRYVGFSASDVYKSLYRHFQTWNDRTQARVVYKNLEGIKVRIIYTGKKEAANLEKGLIIKYKPTDNPNQYWINYNMDNKEKKVLDNYINEPVTDIVVNKDIDIDF